MKAFCRIPSSLCIFLIIFVLFSGMATAYPCNEKTNQKSEPNQFVLQGIESKYKDVQISYSTTSITGKPIFSYKDSKGSHSFTGDKIRTQQTEIGTMVTVTLESIPDSHVTALTLLVPKINLDSSTIEFKTIAIQTTSKTTIAGEKLVKGAVNAYEVINLKGTASHVIS